MRSRPAVLLRRISGSHRRRPLRRWAVGLGVMALVPASAYLLLELADWYGSETAERPAPPATTPTMTVPASGAVTSSSAGTPWARWLFLGGDLEGAREEALGSLRAGGETDPRLQLLLGHIEFELGMRGSAFDRYRAAIELDFTLRSDELLLKNLVRSLDGFVQERAIDFVVEVGAAAALPTLDRAAITHASSLVRTNAAVAAGRIRGGR